MGQIPPIGALFWGFCRFCAIRSAWMDFETVWKAPEALPMGQLSACWLSSTNGSAMTKTTSRTCSDVWTCMNSSDQFCFRTNTSAPIAGAPDPLWPGNARQQSHPSRGPDLWRPSVPCAKQCTQWHCSWSMYIKAVILRSLRTFTMWHNAADQSWPCVPSDQI